MLRIRLAKTSVLALTTFALACGSTSGSGDSDGAGGAVQGSGGSGRDSGGASVAGTSSDAGGSGGSATGGAVSAGGDFGGSEPRGGALSGGGLSTGGATPGGGPASGGASSGGASSGGASSGGASSGGVDTGGTFSGGAGGSTGGAGSRVQCGVEICDTGEVCCGPSDCAFCVNALSGAGCLDTCPGTGGAGGAADDCATRNYAVPELDKTCATSNDCSLGVHTADCCGSQLAVAYRASERTRFAAYEATCGSECDCAMASPRAEDGATLSLITDAVAECVDGRCLARGPENVGTCLEGEFCIHSDDQGHCGAATGPIGSGTCRGFAGLCAYCDCAAPDTPIATPSGERPIAELRVGDLVYSVENEAVVVVPIERVNQRAVFDHFVVEVRLEAGNVLQISGGHPTADGRTFADLVPGGTLGAERILSAELVPYPYEHTYDILPASSTGTYFAGGALIGSTLR